MRPAATIKEGMIVTATSDAPDAARARALARLEEVLAALEGLEPRLAASASSEVQMTLLESATEQIEEAGRLLEQLGRVSD